MQSATATDSSGTTCYYRRFSIWIYNTLEQDPLRTCLKTLNNSFPKKRHLKRLVLVANAEMIALNPYPGDMADNKNYIVKPRAGNLSTELFETI
jgi:hypothetical protein